MSIRIGVDATCSANLRGYGRFTRELLRAMVAGAPEDEFICFVDDRAAPLMNVAAPNVRCVRVVLNASPTSAASANGFRSPADLLRLTRAVWREPLDVFFSPSVYTFFPLPPGLPAVVTIHDAIAERFPELTLPSRRARLFWKCKVAFALRQARLVLTVSAFSARDLRAVLRIPAERIRVAGEAPAEAYRPSESLLDIGKAAERAGLPAGARWFIYVGGINPHKRVEYLVRAHGILAADSADPPYLLLVGPLAEDVFHADRRRVDDAIAEQGSAGLVRWLGYVPDEDLRHLLSGARALVLPSACEGFGLPAVEAAACGTPVIATAESPLPELLEGGGLFLEPCDVPRLVEAMQLLSDDLVRARMGARACARASALSWDSSATAAIAALREAAA
ncbi:MAG: glycosyltransferase family 4 protein [Gemmatimonadaceae bacterium]